MAFRAVEINLISARDLNDVNLFSKIKPYAVAWIKGSQTYDKKKTSVDKENRTNPNWNYPTMFMVEEAALLQGRLVLEVEIRTLGTFSDEEIGRVSVLLKDFVKPSKDGGIQSGSVEHVSYQVRKPSGKPKGMLNFSVKIGEKTEAPNSFQQPSAPLGYNEANAYGSGGAAYTPPPTHKGDEPVTAYPVYPPGPSSAYPPPPPPHHGNNYPPPPHHGNNYPPPPPPSYWSSYPPPPPQDPYHPPPYPAQYQGYPPQGYTPQGYQPQYQGYPPVQQQQPPKKNKFGGLGLGAGLLGGALGGLLIGDMISDGGNFDGGFDDGGGFDF